MLDSIVERKLDNGLKVICLKKNDAPVVSAQVWYKTGSSNESEGIRGISHILEHIMFRGSLNVASEEHTQRINNAGGHCNAFTAEDITAYLNSVPADFLDMLLELESDRMTNLTIDRKILETERKVIIEEYHTYMNNPAAKALLEFRTEFFKNNPYQISPLGDISDIETITDKDLRKYYEMYYTPDNAVIVIVGDFRDEEKIFDKVEEHFGNIKTSERNFDYKWKYKRAYSKSVFMKRRIDFAVPVLITGYPAPASASKDALALNLVQMILSQGETSRIYRSLVRKKSIAVMAGGMNQFLKHAGMSIFFAVFTPDTSYKKVETALTEQVKKIINDGISDREVERIKNILLTSRIFETFYAENICHHIGYSETVEGDYMVWVRKLEELEKVDREKIMEVVGNYWTDDKKHTIYLQPKKFNPMLYTFGLINKIFHGKEK